MAEDAREPPPTCSEEITEGVPVALRAGVSAFLKAHGLEALGELAAAAPEDLTQAFAAEPPDFTLGHRAAVRRLREAACVRPRASPRPWRLELLLQPRRWLAPSVVRFLVAVGELKSRFPGLWPPLWALVLATLLGVQAELDDIWHPFTEWDVRCSHEPLPGNNTGIQYLIIGASKPSARSFSQSLYELGVKRSWQGVDLSVLMWSNLFDDVSRRPENGGRRTSQHVRDIISDRGGILSDSKALMQLSPAEIAAAVSRCRIEALSFAGVENLFWPILSMSPNATVFLAHGTEWEKQWDYSMDFFNPSFVWSLPLFLAVAASPHMLPWTALLHIVDPLIGGHIRARLSSGDPPLTQAWGPYISFWLHGLNLRRGVAHRNSGLQWAVSSFSDFWYMIQQLDRQMPKSRLKQWDMTQNTWQELCGIVNASRCPRSGPLRVPHNPVPDFKFEDYMTFWAVLPLHLLLLWLNALLLKFVWQLVIHPLLGPLLLYSSRIAGAAAAWGSWGLRMALKLVKVVAAVAVLAAVADGSSRAITSGTIR
mmetsp:Transcript_59525/g.184684  ORF Transcript_59525/g.184684 Transcript_59525/m.184684 type:complete len:538 (-) Transcript_59525:15-1628(-)